MLQVAPQRQSWDRSAEICQADRGGKGTVLGELWEVLVSGILFRVLCSVSFWHYFTTARIYAWRWECAHKCVKECLVLKYLDVDGVHEVKADEQALGILSLAFIGKCCSQFRSGVHFHMVWLRAVVCLLVCHWYQAECPVPCVRTECLSRPCASVWRCPGHQEIEAEFGKVSGLSW